MVEEEDEEGDTLSRLASVGVLEPPSFPATAPRDPMVPAATSALIILSPFRPFRDFLSLDTSPSPLLLARPLLPSMDESWLREEERDPLFRYRSRRDSGMGAAVSTTWLSVKRFTGLDIKCAGGGRGGRMGAAEASGSRVSPAASSPWRCNSMVER